MNTLLLYVVQSALCLSLFYGLYLLLLRREAFFQFNRCVLLAILTSSMVLPLIRLPVAEPALVQAPMMQLQELFLPVEQETIPLYTVPPEILAPATPMRDVFSLIALAYLVGFFVSLALALVSIISVARIIFSARSVMYGRQRIMVSPLKISSFTFARWIVISEMDYERFAEEIVAHEAVHLRNGHFWDLLFVNAIAVVQWFNPLVWLLRREVKSLHEYEADRNALNQGIDVTRYKLLLIEKAAGTNLYSVASSFAQTKIKKRIIMMNKQNFNSRARWKALLFIPLAAMILQAFARPEMNREIEQISTDKGSEIFTVEQQRAEIDTLRNVSWKDVEAFINSGGELAQRSATQPPNNASRLPTEEDWNNAAAVVAQNSDPPQISAQISAPQTQDVLYVGIHTPVSIVVSGVAYENISATISQGTLTKVSENVHGNFIAVPVTPGEATITVFVEGDGQGQVLASRTFSARLLPVPKVTVGGQTGGVMNKDTLLSQRGLFIVWEDFSWSFTITRFHVEIDSPDGFRSAPSSSSFFTDAQKALINSLESGQRVFITDIRARDPNEVERNFPDITFIIE